MAWIGIQFRAYTSIYMGEKYLVEDLHTKNNYQDWSELGVIPVILLLMIKSDVFIR